MDPATLTALRGSIRKWQGIVDFFEKDGGCHDCPLCKLFHPMRIGVKSRLGCVGCPVQAKVDSSYCSNTPHVAYSNAAVHKNLSLGGWDEAYAELMFLISLLPEGESAW